MANNTYVEIPLQEATALANLSGIVDDLLAAQEFSKLILDIYRDNFARAPLVDPLTTALVVRYCRPFIGGIRNPWPKDAVIQSFNTDQLELHNMLLNLRSKHFTHSVNNYEMNRPIARYWQERVREEGICSVECNRHRVIGLSSTELENVLELCSFIERYVGDLVAKEKVKLLALIRSLPIDDVLRWGRQPTLQVLAPSTRRRPF